MAIRDAHTTLTRHTQSGYCNRVVWPRIATVSPALVLCAWLGMASLDVGLAQEPSRAPHESGSEQPVDQRPDASAVSKPESESESKPEGPPREPRFLPPVLRPQLTSEEEEEAGRLRKLAAKYGTDPTAIVGRVQLTNQYVNLPHGARLDTTIARVDVPFLGNWLLRTDTPVHTWFDPNRPGLSSAQGVGDLAATLGYRIYNTPEYAFLIGATSTFPTASNDMLGTGKYTVGPVMATGRFLPGWESFLFGVFTHRVSTGGDPSRADVSLTNASVQINTIWERWWTTVQSVWQVDWEHKTKSSMTMEFEVGRNLVGRWGVFMRPGVGVWGTNVPGAYDWNIEVGTRYMFKSF